MIPRPAVSVFPFSLPNNANPQIATCTAPNVPVKIVASNNNRSSFSIGNANPNFDLFFSIGVPTVVGVAGGQVMPIGLPVTPGAGNFTFLCVFTLTQDIYIWYANGVAEFTGEFGVSAPNELTVQSFSTLGGTIGLGMLVTGAGVPPNTFIVANGTGIGGLGTYYVSTNPGVVGPALMQGSIFPIPVFAYEMSPALEIGTMAPGWDATQFWAHPQPGF